MRNENVATPPMSMMGGLKTSVRAVLVFALLTGAVYPLVITGLAQVVFPERASGSLIMHNGQPAGSELIGQPFDDPGYFWSRPSATSPSYNGGSSSGSNLAVSNPAQAEAVAARVRKLHASGIPVDQPIPIDLVTASGSGLDPHLSVAAAAIQIPRVARTRGLSETLVRGLVEQATEGRQLGVLGEPRVNVLKLNLALDAAQRAAPQGAA